MTKFIYSRELRSLFRAKVDLLLLDVRAPEAFARDHLEGACNIPMDTPDFVQAVVRAAGGRSRKTVVYCGSAACDSAARATRELIEAGHTDVYCYEGGLAAWRREADHDEASRQGELAASAADAAMRSTVAAIAEFHRPSAVGAASG